MSWIKRNIPDGFDEFDPVTGGLLGVVGIMLFGMSILVCYVLTEILFQKWEVGPFWGAGYAIFCLSIGGLTYYLGTKDSEGFLPAKFFFGFLAICGVLLGPLGFMAVFAAWFTNYYSKIL